jgi:nucleotide-binding universal stress UspA family protein
LYLFDCIEFNQCFRCADVAAEVAFLAMGLAHLGRADLAGAFVDAYIAGSRDVELRKLLNFHTYYRGYVRGKGLSFRPDEPDLCHLLACLGGRPPGLSIQVFLVAGHIAEEIGRFAVEHRSDAIVLVRRSQLEVGRARVLRAVLDRTPCPVLLVGAG